MRPFEIGLARFNASVLAAYGHGLNEPLHVDVVCPVNVKAHRGAALGPDAAWMPEVFLPVPAAHGLGVQAARQLHIGISRGIGLFSCRFVALVELLKEIRIEILDAKLRPALVLPAATQHPGTVGTGEKLPAAASRAFALLQPVSIFPEAIVRLEA